MKYLLMVCCLLRSLVFLGQDSLLQARMDSVMKEDMKAAEKRKQEAVGAYLPKFSGTLNARQFSNADLQGKVVYINFWFAACAPCIEEFDELNELYNELKDDKNFEFLSFTYESPEKIEEIKKRYKLQFKVVSMSMEDCQRVNQQSGFPTHIIVDKVGIIKYVGPVQEDDLLNTREYVMKSLQAIIRKQL